MKRPSSLRAHRGVLLDLRAGTITFDEATRELRPTLEARAGWFLRNWSWSGQSSIDVEDLFQEMLIELWRAVDNWDPTRADLVDFVDASTGRAAQQRLKKVAGYPDPRRSRPMLQTYLAERSGSESTVDPLTALLDSRSVLVEKQEERIDLRRRAAEVLATLSGIDRDVVEHVLEGGSFESAAEYIYADPNKRIAYRLDASKHARQEVGRVARRIAAARAAA